MVMLSDLLRSRLVDADGRRAKLLDVIVDLQDGGYPKLTRLVFEAPDRTTRTLALEALVSSDWPARRLVLPPGEPGEPVTPGTLHEAVLLRRDVLDALVLDLQHLRALRANDLWLERDDSEWLLRAVDASPWAILRRLGRGRLGRGRNQDLVDWRYIEFLRGDPEAARSGQPYCRRMDVLPAGQLARLMDALPYLHAAELLILLPAPLAASVLEMMAPERQLQVFEELDQPQAVSLLARMAPEAATDLLGRLEPDQLRAYLEQLPQARRAKVIQLLSYPEASAGGIMTNDVVFAPAGLTVAQARNVLRDRLRSPNFVYFVYLVDDENSRVLRGVLTLRDLVVAADGARLHDLMQRHLLTIDQSEPAEAAALRVIDSHLAALPVVDTDNRLLGAVTVDAAVAQIAPQAWTTQAPRVFS